ncbi:hypothetical protein [Streptomyces sp. NPDC040750]|uniref:hypothetical protein n=1 Tax=Streptomyces sp. NPDC040750 TaxID=3154491 RepID=UPI0033C3ADA5
MRDAVGLTNAGTQCPNQALDQQQVAELLDAVGPPAGGTSLDSLPVPLLLSVSDYDVVELPQSVTPWPSLVYTLRGKVAEWDGAGIHIELWVKGPVKVAWSKEAYALGCEVSPDFATMESAVASGSARAIGGAALDQLCSRVKSEARGAVGALFSGVSVSVGPDGTPRIGGTIGDETAFLRVEFEPAERTVIYTGSVHVFQSHPVTDGEAQLSGDLQVQLRITTGEEDYTASLAAAVAVLAAAVVLLAPVAQWAAGSEFVSGLGAGVDQLLVRIPLRVAP